MRRSIKALAVTSAVIAGLAAAPALVEAVQTATRCLVPLDGRLLDEKSRARATDQVDLAISELRRWRERTG